MSFSPTDEQLQAIALFREGETLAIEAGAGTGKTTTLLQLAYSTPRRGQYIAFNKSIVVDAGQRMPRSVTCSTAHSLAFRALGYRYKHRLNGPRVWASEIANRLRIRAIEVEIDDGPRLVREGPLANIVMQTVTRFCQSADVEVGRQHVPYIDGIDDLESDGVTRGRKNNRLVATEVVPWARAMWDDLAREKGRMPFRHEHYLKLWQLDDPRVETDYILFDEAQDANPVLLAIVEAQDHAQRVYVGDSQQAIMEWNGAVNALARVQASARTFLTQSFRFGDDIAGVANDVLERLDAELRLRGCDRPGRIGTVDEPDALLSRTNAAAVEGLLAAAGAGRRAHLLGGGADVLAFVRGAEELKAGKMTTHPELCVFGSWLQVQDYVRYDAGGGDLKLLVGLIDQFGVGSIRRVLEGMPGEDEAEVVFSTVHKAKGREWQRVQLAGDLEGTSGDSAAEDRLLYVAVTRAIEELDISAVAGRLPLTLPLESVS